MGAGDDSEGFVKWNIEVSSDGEETPGFVNSNIDMFAAGARDIEVSSDGDETQGFVNLKSSDGDETWGFVNVARARVHFVNSNIKLFNCWKSVWGVDPKSKARQSDLHLVMIDKSTCIA